MKVLLADDHPLFLDGLRNLLESRGIDVVGVARDGVAAVEQAHLLGPDVVLLDIQMPRLDGLAALRRIKAEMPAMKVVMLTMSAEDEDLFHAIKSGACGYLLKTQESEDIFELLSGLERGEAVLSPGLAVRILEEFTRRESELAASEPDSPAASLNSRQIEILQLVADGLTYKETGARMLLTERTIKYHMAEIIGRLQVRNRAEAIASARKFGLLE